MPAITKVVNGEVVLLTPEEQAAVEAQWSAYDAEVTAAGGADALLTQKQRAAAKKLINELEATGKALRAVVILVVEELNILREWTRDFKTATNAAGTLAAFKTNVAALATLNDRTLSQSRTAILATLDTSDADT